MYCYKCGAENSNDSCVCSACGTTIQVTAPAPQYQVQEDPMMKFILPVGRSALSIAAGYLGLFSLLLLPAPLAIVVSILALRDLKKRPELAGKGRAIFGLVMGILGSALLLLVAGSGTLGW